MVSSGGTTPTDELRMLRARAYGPNADIHDDAAALQRLRELEERPVPADTVRRTAAEPAPAEPVPARDGSDLESDREAAPEEVGPPAGRRAFVPTTRRGRVMAAAACLVVAVVATASITTAVVRKVQADPRTIATLAVDPTIELGEAFGGSDESTQPTVAHEDFYGLTPIVIPGWWGQTSGRCLILTPTAGLDTVANGWSSVGGMNCEAGSFSTSAQFVVSDDYGVPSVFRDRFPDGTALRFELDGSTVVVLDGTTD